MEFTIKYKEDSNIGMVCEKESLETVVSAVDSLLAVKSFSIAKVNEGFINSTYNQTETIDYINGLSEVNEVVHAVNFLHFTKEGKEMLIINII